MVEEEAVMNHLLKNRLMAPLHEGERGYGSWHYSATAGEFYGVMGAPGAMEGVGPMLANDDRLLENHLKNLRLGRPVDVVIQDLLETGKIKAAKALRNATPYEKTLNNYASSTKMHVYRGSIK